jgi:pSer/pThr/pTyr-binding forkhead associated (FHA) protein
MFKESDGCYIEDGVTSVQDKPSGNHTTVNGKDITGQGKIKLNDGDVIGISSICEATVNLT